MAIILHETQIFSPISVFSAYQRIDEIMIEKYENFQKGSFRNRYVIQTANGIKTMTIPLCKGKNQQMLISDVEISYDEDWVKNHIQTIKSAYGKSPYFEFYYDDIAKLLNRKHRFLFDLNYECLAFMISKLKLEKNILFSDSYQRIIDHNMDKRNHDWMAEKSSKPYIQVWSEKYNFEPNLSILDLLFCTGPEAKTHLN